MMRNPILSASRVPPPRVPPVFIAGVRYAQVAGDPDVDGQVGGILAAYDASNHELWRLKIYANARRPDLAGDVQDVWFRSLRVEGGLLLIENERGERFQVDPATLSCVDVPKRKNVAAQGGASVDAMPAVGSLQLVAGAQSLAREAMSSARKAQRCTHRAHCLAGKPF